MATSYEILKIEMLYGQYIVTVQIRSASIENQNFSFPVNAEGYEGVPAAVKAALSEFSTGLKEACS